MNSFYRYVIDFDANVISGAMALRLELKRKKADVSCADALGHFLSRKMGIKFLTGIRLFKD